MKTNRTDMKVLAGLILVLSVCLIITGIIFETAKAATTTVGVHIEFVSVTKTGNVSLGHPVTSPISTVRVEDGTIVVK